MTAYVSLGGGCVQKPDRGGSCLPQHLPEMTNGAPQSSLQHHGSKVYGVVQRVGSDKEQEVMAREWTVSHLQDEMRYIREVSGNRHNKQPGL